jgi:hypothetical protein
MSPLRFSADPIARRLRWVMLAAMLLNSLITLLAQPAAYWLNPQSAVRFDAQPAHTPINPIFDFFLSRGCLAYLAATFVSVAVVFLLVSLLPRLPALISIFTVLLCHSFVLSNWIAFLFHPGILGFIANCIVLSAAIVLAAFPIPTIAAPAFASLAIRRLCYVMVSIIVFDAAMTLLGQPASYWSHPQTANEANPLFHFFLAQSWQSFLLVELLYLAVAFLLVSTLAQTSALITLFAFLLGHFMALSTWPFYRYRLGIQVPIAVAILLSAGIVLSAFPTPSPTTSSRRQQRPSPSGL